MHVDQHASRTPVADEPATESFIGLPFLWLELTEKCNLRCVHCYTDSSPERPLHGVMSRKDWESALEQARDLGCAQVQFIGGEASLHPELPNLIDRAGAAGFTFIELFSNGVFFSKALRRSLVENDVHLAVSYYSSNKSTHDAVTLVKGSHERTERTIAWARAQNLHVRANVVGTPLNVEDADRAIARLHELGVRATQTTRVLGAGRGIPLVSGRSMRDRLCGYCWRGSLCVTAAGNVYPCPVERELQVGSFEQSLAAIVAKEELLRFRRRVRDFFAQPDVSPDGCTTPCTCTCTCTCVAPCTCTCVR